MTAERKLFEEVSKGPVLHLRFHGHDFFLGVALSVQEATVLEQQIQEDGFNLGVAKIPIEGQIVVMTTAGMVVFENEKGRIKSKASDSWKQGHGSMARYIAESKGSKPKIYVQHLRRFCETSPHQHGAPEHYYHRSGEALVQNGTSFDQRLNRDNPVIVKPAYTNHILKTVGKSLITVVVCEDDNYIRTSHLI